MSDFLERIAARALNLADVIRPRVPSRFEPVARADGGLEVFGDQFVDLPPLAPVRTPGHQQDRSAVSPGVMDQNSFVLARSVVGDPRAPAASAPPSDRIEALGPRPAALPPTLRTPDDRIEPTLPRSRPRPALTQPTVVVRDKGLEGGRRQGRTDPQTPAAEQRPDIHVTIGRIEVRAVQRAEDSPKEHRPPRGPTLSLDDYLKQSNGRSR